MSVVSFSLGCSRSLFVDRWAWALMASHEARRQDPSLSLGMTVDWRST
jgi:hypothetical protein